MRLRRWDELPECMKNESVREYYEILVEKRSSLALRRLLDVIVAGVMLMVLLPLFIVVGTAIKIESAGPVLFRQTRVTRYGKCFRIYKFRTMIDGDETGLQITVRDDARITRMGAFLRKYRIDELPQLLNIITGDMTFVGTRPEVVRYVEKYTDEMLATLLLPAGITSEASIQYKDEDTLLTNAEEADEIYLTQVLPEKMKYNLKSMAELSLSSDIRTILRTIRAVVGKDKALEDTFIESTRKEVNS